MTSIYSQAGAQQTPSEARPVDSQLPAPVGQALAAHFRGLLADPAADDASTASPSQDLPPRVSDMLASLMLRASTGRGGTLAEADTSARRALPSSSEKKASADEPDASTARKTASVDTPTSSTRKHAASDPGAVAVASQMSVIAAVSQVSDARSASNAASATPAQTSVGELVQLLSEQCQGVYVGLDAAGSRVMLRLGGAMTGVSAEIVNNDAGLCVRMHVRDHDKWADIAVRKDELEQLLSDASHAPVRIEPVFEGGRS